MKLRTLIGAAVAAGLMGSTALTFAAEVPAGTTLAAEQVFKYRVLDNINVLDPQLVEDRDTSNVINQLFEGLYSADAEGNPIPGAAVSYEANADNTVYTFKLRPEAKWSNGDPVTANDFVYAWQRAVDPATASNYAYYLDTVNILNAAKITEGTKPNEAGEPTQEAMPVTDLGVKAIDDLTLEVTLKASTPWFVKTLAHATLFPVHKATVEQFGTDWTKPENIVSNGAYTLAENSPGERVVIKRNPTYWNNAKTVIEEVQFLTINDENIGLTRWRSGEVDQTDVPTGQYPALEAELPDETFSVPDFCTYYFSVNMRDNAPEALKNKLVRQALNLAIDRDVIVNAVLQGGQTPAYSFTNPHTAGFEMPDIPAANMTQAERDAKAKELMAEAGYGPENPLTFDYIYNTSEGHKAIATVVGQMWKEKLGVTMNLADMEFEVLLEERHAGNFQLARNAWCGDYNEASTFLSLHDSKSEQNDQGWANAEVDKLLADAKTSANPNEQYKQVEAIAAEEVPIMPIYFYAKVFMQHSDVKGWPVNNVEQIWYAKDFYKVAE